MPSWDTAASRRIEDTTPHEGMEMGTLGTGAGAQVARANGGQYTQVPDQPASPFDNGPAEYRGANVTHPYRSDLGAQILVGEDTGYPRYGSGPTAGTSYSQGPSYSDRSPHIDNTSYGEASSHRSGAQLGYFQHPQEPSFLNSSPAPTYHTYQPTQPYSPTDSTRYAPAITMGSMNISPTQVRPPSLLQVGRKPLPGSGREV
jgi:hypothetical protein